MKRGSFWMLAVIYTAPVAIAVTIAAISGCGPVVEAQPEQPAVLVQPQPRTVVVQEQAPPPRQLDQPPPAPAAVADPQIVQLVAPIALYPDPLLADTLPASTYPQEVQEASQWLQANPQPADAQIEAQAWEPSVKAIIHYPTVIQTLSGDPQWTESLGTAVTANQAGVMLAVQDLRQQAATSGNLVDTPQTVVVKQDTIIAIQPANPQVVYVPTYDPVVVYTQPSPIVYGVAFPTGVWLVDGLAWDTDVIFVGDWHGGYVYGPRGWYRDRYWRHDRFVRWGHDDHFGRAPFVDHARWAAPHSFRGRSLPPVVVTHVTQRIRTANVERRRPTGLGASPERARPPGAERTRPPVNPSLEHMRPPPGANHAGVKPPGLGPEHPKSPAPAKPAPKKEDEKK